jgi:hypothetical protein
MKVKITATITYETELTPDCYDYLGEAAPKTDDDMLAVELHELESGDSALTASLLEVGDLSDIKIEKIEEKAEAA